MSLDYTVRPLSDRSWLRPDHRRETSRFTAAWSDTLALLGREIAALRGKHVVLGIDVEERHLRLDGRLRADARAATPAVEIAFDSKHGPLLYRSDRFIRQTWKHNGAESWQHNVRAVAMTLEALRAVDRYAASASGEQYRGYRALPAGRGDASSGMTVTYAADILIRASRLPVDIAVAHDRAQWSSRGQLVVRGARANTHPDRNGGDTAQWNLVDNATQTLQQAGWLPKAVTG